MTLIKSPKIWEMPGRLITPEKDYISRRQFLKSLGLLGIGSMTLMSGCSGEKAAEFRPPAKINDTIPAPGENYPFRKNEKYTSARALTDEIVAASYNNYYEFTTEKDQVWQLAAQLQTEPWKISISGEVEKALTVDIDDLLKKMPLEERIYRHRCVEAWSMIVPWSGFSLKSLIDFARPTHKANYLKMTAFFRRDEAPGQKAVWYPFPYYEALTMAEAINELSFLATGIYGHNLPKQHGAPLRLVVPWKYGFKSIKGIVKFEFTERRPGTFWNDFQSEEYGFTANVNPTVPHPRWSQATERLIGVNERIPTRMYNGYEAFVAHLYR